MRITNELKQALVNPPKESHPTDLVASTPEGGLAMKFDRMDVVRLTEDNMRFDFYLGEKLLGQLDQLPPLPVGNKLTLGGFMALMGLKLDEGTADQAPPPTPQVMMESPVLIPVPGPLP